MSKEKQIEEMAKVMCGGCPDNKECMHCLCADWYRAETLYNAGYRKQSENTVEVIRCKDCRYFGRKDDNFYLRQCEGCGDINEPCGFCVMFGFCTNKNGYCYKGERREDDA